jgi:hypothetical protein
MPDALWFTDDPEACKLLARDPFALLVGFAIDQQVTVQKAFSGRSSCRSGWARSTRGNSQSAT